MADNLPAGWTFVKDPAGDYYFHAESGESRWDPPPNPAGEAVKPTPPTSPRDTIKKPVEAPTAKLPAGWAFVKDPSGDYYFHAESGESRWDPPTDGAPTPQPAADAPLPAGWQVCHDAEGDAYYYHADSDTSLWHAPTPADIAAATKKTGGGGDAAPAAAEPTPTPATPAKPEKPKPAPVADQDVPPAKPAPSPHVPKPAEQHNKPAEQHKHAEKPAKPPAPAPVEEPAAAAAPDVKQGPCGQCDCQTFQVNPFKKGICQACWHNHSGPASGEHKSVNPAPAPVLATAAVIAATPPTTPLTPTPPPKNKRPEPPTEKKPEPAATSAAPAEKRQTFSGPKPPDTKKPEKKPEAPAQPAKPAGPKPGPKPAPAPAPTPARRPSASAPKPAPKPAGPPPEQGQIRAHPHPMSLMLFGKPSGSWKCTLCQTGPHPNSEARYRCDQHCDIDVCSLCWAKEWAAMNSAVAPPAAAPIPEVDMSATAAPSDVPKCKHCGCTTFTVNPFKVHICKACWHNHTEQRSRERRKFYV